MHTYATSSITLHDNADKVFHLSVYEESTCLCTLALFMSTSCIVCCSLHDYYSTLRNLEGLEVVVDMHVVSTNDA